MRATTTNDEVEESASLVHRSHRQLDPKRTTKSGKTVPEIKHGAGPFSSFLLLLLLLLAQEHFVKPEFKTIRVVHSRHLHA